MAEEPVVRGEEPANEANPTSSPIRRSPIPAVPADLPLYLTADEAASLLRTSRSGIYAIAARGRLAGATRVGRRLLVSRDALLRFLSEGRAPSPRGTRR